MRISPALRTTISAGDFQWFRTIKPGPVGAPVVARLSTGPWLVFVAGSQNQLHAFREDGTVLWTVTLDGPVLGSPAISDNRIYVATQRSLYAIR